MNFFRRITTASSGQGKRRPEDAEVSDESRPSKVSRVVEMEDEVNCYATMESDTEQPSPPARMDWRTDPAESLSDWTIEVVSVVGSGDETVDSKHYHVHKSILILESEYFRSFFGQYPQATTADEGSPSATRLELHEKAARFFPELLDYMYGLPLKFDSENSTVFHFFGHYFGMRRLRWEAKSFWSNDMSHETVAAYYQDAIVFGDPKVMKAVEEACCQEAILLRFEPDSPILQVPDPQLWLYLVEHTSPRHSEHLSRLVASFCSEHEVDPETFVELTAPEHLPKVAFSVTLILLDLERTIINEDDTSLSSLQDRCIAALERRWSEIEVDKEEFSDFLSQQSHAFLAELFKRTMSAAQRSQKRNSAHRRPGATLVSPTNQEAEDDASRDSGEEEGEDGTDHMDEDVSIESAGKEHEEGGDGASSSDTEDESRLPAEITKKCAVSNQRDDPLSEQD